MSSLEFANVAILCVAINAYPPLARLLQKLAKSTTPDEDIQQVLAEHGGKRFSERDNKEDLAVLNKHLVPMMVKARQQQNLPLFVDSFNGDEVPCIQKLLSDLMITGDAGSSTRSFKQWCWQVDSTRQHTIDDISTTSLVDYLDYSWDFGDGSAPELIVFKHHRLNVKLVEDIASLGLGTKFNGSGKQQQEEQEKLEKLEKLEKAQRQYEKIVDLLQAIGIPDTASSGKDILQSLEFLQNWLATFQAEEGDERTYKLAMRIQDILSQSMDIWDILLTNVDKAKETSKANVDKLALVKKYVLRAFLLKTRDSPESTTEREEGSKDQYVMVRRLGKPQGPSHYSMLWSDGRCWPTSLKDPDMKGRVIESMWVCVDNDDECIADRNGTCEQPLASTINTVVADPDDDIFCSVCTSFESFSYNQIVICDGCERGYHQMCHDPVIMEDELNLDVWRCRDCKRRIKRPNISSEASESGGTTNKRPNTDNRGSINVVGSGNPRGATRSTQTAIGGGNPVQMSCKNKSRKMDNTVHKEKN